MFRRQIKLSASSLLLLLLLVVYTNTSGAVSFSGCDHVYNLNPGLAYLNSPYYPNSYPGGTSCRYKFIAPLDYEIQLKCSIQFQNSGGACSTEFFYVATDGDVQLRGSEQLCGTGSFERTTLFRTLVVAYNSNNHAAYGKFNCTLYARPQACDCGWSVNTKIMNGVETMPNEFPSVVLLRDLTSSLPSFCGGTIVSHYYVLTAAHCTAVQRDPTKIMIVAGDHNTQSTADNRYTDYYSVQQIYDHPNFQTSPSASNDISLLRTTAPIEWSRGVGPACLPPSNQASNTFAYFNVDVVGWGTTYFAGPTSNTLQKITVQVLGNTDCQRAYSGYATITSSQMCTYDSSGSSKDSCQYDSGGPVYYRGARQFLLGCISFGKSCGEGGYAVGVNTRITSYLTWIYQIMGSPYCSKAM